MNDDVPAGLLKKVMRAGGGWGLPVLLIIGVGLAMAWNWHAASRRGNEMIPVAPLRSIPHDGATSPDTAGVAVKRTAWSEDLPDAEDGESLAAYLSQSSPTLFFTVPAGETVTAKVRWADSRREEKSLPFEESAFTLQASFP